MKPEYVVTTFVIAGTTYAIYRLANATSEAERRASLVARALADVGKAGVGPVAIAQVGYPDLKYKAWCQMWILSLLRLEELTSVQWQIGKGFVGQLGLPITHDPQPGDLAYWHAPRQHMGLVVSTHPLKTIDGAQTGDVVSINDRSRSPDPVFYSIRKLL